MMGAEPGPELPGLTIASCFGAIPPTRTHGSRQGDRMGKSRLAALIMVLCSAALPTAAQGAMPVFNPDRIAWAAVEMSASKLLVSMDVSMTVEDLPVAAAVARLVTPMSAKEESSLERLVALRFVTEGLGRRNEVELMINPDTGAALQRTTFRTGNRPKYRVYRFEDDRILRLTSRPASGEDDLPPDRWSEQSEEVYPYPDGAAGTAVAEATSLIYLATTSTIAGPGDRLEILALASDEFHRVELVGEKPADIGTDYFAIGGERIERRTGKTSALRIAILGRSLVADQEEEFELLGLKDLEVFLDPVTRIPLKLRGKVDFFGRVEFDLNHVTLATKSTGAGPIDRGPEEK